MYSITIIFRYKFKIVNNKEKPSTKMAQYVHDIELHFTVKETKGHKQEN